MRCRNGKVGAYGTAGVEAADTAAAAAAAAADGCDGGGIGRAALLLPGATAIVARRYQSSIISVATACVTPSGTGVGVDVGAAAPPVLALAGEAAGTAAGLIEPDDAATAAARGLTGSTRSSL